MMTTTTGSAAESERVRAGARIRPRLKTAVVTMLLAGAGLILSGCYDDPYYYGHRNVRAGYYASYAPRPYYGYDPYPYGYGYAPGVAVGVSSYRSYPRYGRPPYYGRYAYGRSGYYHRGDGRKWDRRRSWDRDRTQRRVRRDRDRDRDRQRRRTTAPDEQRLAPPDAHRD